ncbi:MAG: hypothetical protein A2W25_12260 [candidate division Zixibacteria bacterium RBG_16_53_22]|nr:MAG: hypothetical protein A2W25_12260 [candidate division Zixibacteria bacterium RBG_16_53_22]
MSNWSTEIRSSRFWNCGDRAVVIAASINYLDGYIFDWAAYIGSASPASEEYAAEYVVEHGNKLSRDDAAYFFPDMPIVRWRH